MKISYARDRGRRNKQHQALGGLFLKDRVYLHAQTSEDNDWCKGDPSGAVDHAFVPDIWVGHTSTEHQDQSKANQCATNTHVEIVLLSEQQRKGLHIAGATATALGLNIRCRLSGSDFFL